MNETQFYLFLPLVFGVIALILDGLLTAGHRLNASANGRRRTFGGFLIKGFHRDTSRNLAIFGAVPAIVGVIGIVAAR